MIPESEISQLEFDANLAQSDKELLQSTFAPFFIFLKRVGYAGSNPAEILDKLQTDPQIAQALVELDIASKVANLQQITDWQTVISILQFETEPTHPLTLLRQIVINLFTEEEREELTKNSLS